MFHRFNANPAAALEALSRYVELSAGGYWRGEAERQIQLLRGEIKDGS